MAKILYITANPKELEKSASLQVGKTFIQNYKEQNPKDQIDKLDLFEFDVPPVERTLLSAIQQLYEGKDYVDLEHTEKRLIEKRNAFVEKFKEYDKYVIVFPMWNWSYPPEVKHFIDAVIVARETFKYGDDGSIIGLLDNKKLVIIEASGGIYSEKPQLDFGKIHLTAAFKFIGVTDVKTINVEGTSLPDNFDKAIKQGSKEAKSLAKDF